jgi:ubiquitin C
MSFRAIYTPHFYELETSNANYCHSFNITSHKKLLQVTSRLHFSWNKMKVIIVAGAREFLLEIGLQDPVLDIKRRIQQLVGVPVAAQILAVSGRELVDGLDMEDYPIVIDGTRIELTIKPMMPAFSSYCGMIQIIVKFSARQINIEVDRTDTVRSLKEKIHIFDGTPIKRMSLFFSGVELDEDFRNLSEYGIHEFSEIVVFLKTMTRIRDDPPSRKLSIVVQTSSCLLNAACIPLEMKDSSTVNDMRQLLLSRKILPQDDYLFIHKQRIMRDSCSLRWHGVDNGDSLYVFKGTVSRSGY